MIKIAHYEFNKHTHLRKNDKIAKYAEKNFYRSILAKFKEATKVNCSHEKKVRIYGAYDGFA